MKVTVKITITKEYKIQIKIKDEENREIPVKLRDNDSEYSYNPSISFDDKYISICEENEKSIQFMKEWIEEPEEYKMYSVQYQRKEYQLLSEVLFGIIVNEFKERIERKYIIENTILEIPRDNKQLLQRIKISLESLGLRGIELDEEEIDFDYKEQGAYLHEIFEKKRENEED